MYVSLLFMSQGEEVSPETGHQKEPCQVLETRGMYMYILVNEIGA